MVKNKNIFSGVLINLLLLSFPCLATEDFYVFDVGQGNCNFAVYKESKIGFIFDAGSKNSKTISKISQFQTEEDEFAVFAEKKKQEASLQTDIDYFSFFNEVVQSETTPKKPIIGKDMSFQTSAKKDTRIYSVREKIKGKIKYLGPYFTRMYKIDFTFLLWTPKNTYHEHMEQINFTQTSIAHSLGNMYATIIFTSNILRLGPLYIHNVFYC